ncbi:MAG: transcriptional repressor LexA, partial [Planctomycetota bacterium]
MEEGLLTPRQREVLHLILSTVREEGYFPTVRQIGEALGLRSPATVNKHLKGLLRRRALVRRKGRVVPAPHLLSEPGGVPVVGRVAAGLPIDAVENREGTLSLSDLFGGEGLFAVRVAGDSMEGAGIFHGDMVVVRSGSEAVPGEVVLAYVGPDQEATVKVFRRGPSGGVVLEPRNPRHAPLRVEGDPHF